VQIAPETWRAKYRGIKNAYSVHLVGLPIEHIKESLVGLTATSGG
jgi:hypothetical protein